MKQSRVEDKRYIYIACPWAPMGGGMFKIADYLVQYQQQEGCSPALRPLDTRGGKSLFLSIFVLTIAILKIVFGRIGGDLVGVHVNVAERLSLVRKGAIIALSRLMGLPVVLHLHAAQLPAFYTGLPEFGKVLIRFVFGSATVCLVLGERARCFVIDELGVSPDKVRILVNGVPLLKVADKVRNTDDVFRFLFVGNLMERKGVSDLINALASDRVFGRPGWKAVFAGGGDVSSYQDLVGQKGLADRVDFVGWVGQEEAAKLMSGSDVLVLPSYDEGLPLVILEALGRGLPVICTPVGEIPDFLSDKSTAVFVEAGNIESIASALVLVMDDPLLRARLSKNGTDSYLHMFAFPVFCKNIYAIYDEFVPGAALTRSGMDTAGKKS